MAVARLVTLRESLMLTTPDRNAVVMTAVAVVTSVVVRLGGRVVAPVGTAQAFCEGVGRLLELSLRGLGSACGAGVLLLGSGGTPLSWWILPMAT